MKVFASMFLLLFSLGGLNAQTIPTGVWNTGNNNTKVEITEVDGVYFGEIISSDNPKAKIGKQLLKGVKLDGKEWKGKLFAPKKGEWVDVTLKPTGDLLKITVKSGFWSKTLEWMKESGRSR